MLGLAIVCQTEHARVCEAAEFIHVAALGCELDELAEGVGVTVCRQPEHGQVVIVVDACAGVADVRTGRPVTSKHTVLRYSAGKGITATVVHVLAQRGQLDYDLRIDDGGPEFARHGKGGITLQHALTQSAGILALPPDVTDDDFAGREGAHVCDRRTHMSTVDTTQGWTFRYDTNTDDVCEIVSQFRVRLLHAGGVSKSDITDLVGDSGHQMCARFRQAEAILYECLQLQAHCGHGRNSVGEVASASRAGPDCWLASPPRSPLPMTPPGSVQARPAAS